MIVVDCSVALASVLAEEFSAEAIATLQYIKDNEALPLVPLHFMAEFANGLLMAKRRKRIQAHDMQYRLHQWLHAPLEVDTVGDLEDVLDLAEKHDLTIYDAGYLELALRLNAPLATLDNDLLKAAKKEKIAFNVRHA